MNNRFTQSAQNALNNALEYAREFGHTYIGSEHILLGLMAEKDGVASKLLENRSADFDQSANMVKEISGSGKKSNVGASDMTPRTKKIIESSAYQAMRLGQNYIGTEHILLAIVSESDSYATSILRKLGVSSNAIANAVAGGLQKGASENQFSGMENGYPQGKDEGGSAR